MCAIYLAAVITASSSLPIWLAVFCFEFHILIGSAPMQMAPAARAGVPFGCVHSAVCLELFCVPQLGALASLQITARCFSFKPIGQKTVWSCARWLIFSRGMQQQRHLANTTTMPCPFTLHILLLCLFP
jgi:hypothetical protein